jgi:hypothetical protein
VGKETPSFSETVWMVTIGLACEVDPENWTGG